MLMTSRISRAASSRWESLRFAIFVSFLALHLSPWACHQAMAALRGNPRVKSLSHVFLLLYVRLRYFTPPFARSCFVDLLRSRGVGNLHIYPCLIYLLKPNPNPHLPFPFLFARFVLLGLIGLE